jgi:hypothetical protein
LALKEVSRWISGGNTFIIVGETPKEKSSYWYPQIHGSHHPVNRKWYTEPRYVKERKNKPRGRKKEILVVSEIPREAVNLRNLPKRTLLQKRTQNGHIEQKRPK